MAYLASLGDADLELVKNEAFFAAKKKYDPDGLFSNRFYEKYGDT